MRLTSHVAFPLTVALTISACASHTASPRTPSTPRSTSPRSTLEVRQGLASFYGPGLEGKLTASGVALDKKAMIAAHPSYPFGTVVRVTNLTNRRQVIVRVIDRGPGRGPRDEGVIIDVSSGAAKTLGFVRQGRTRVRLEVLRWGE